jgi:hypothetical protein
MPHEMSFPAAHLGTSQSAPHGLSRAMHLQSLRERNRGDSGHLSSSYSSGIR